LIDGKVSFQRFAKDKKRVCVEAIEE